MMYFVSSIVILTIIFWLLYRQKILKVCPICAATVLTWLGGTIALYSNVSWADPLLVAVLMGASLGATADRYGSRFGFLWKSGVVILGFPAVYYIVTKQLAFAAVLVGTLGILTLFSWTRWLPKAGKEQDMFKDCCS